MVFGDENVIFNWWKGIFINEIIVNFLNKLVYDLKLGGIKDVNMLVE